MSNRAFLSQNAAENLEFDRVKALVSELCSTKSGSERAEEMHPSTDINYLKQELNCVHEYKRSFEQIGIPGILSGEINKEIEALDIRNSVLTEEQFIKIISLSKDCNNLIRFFIKNKELYPCLYKTFKDTAYTDQIIALVERVLDHHGQIRTKASAELADIRSKLETVRRNVERQFQAALAHYRDADMLDETRESYINGRRTLAVRAEFKRRVKGMILGTSGSGRVAYIEPASTLPLNNELAMLKQEEQDEIYRILRQLTDQMRDFQPVLREYQHVLVEVDFYAARARFAQKTDAHLPLLHNGPVMDYYDAYHPLLLLQNKQSGAKTHPHTLRLKDATRFLVISGPNAGGKSITLKSIGLLQCMIQSGMLIPVHERSTAGIFKQILTDIGDHQSIENQLSTYSYRLQSMRRFLDITDQNTMVLIDEFGTGSDPELGGALAEVCFEELYRKGAYGVFTTHYSNIKVLTDRLPEAQNAGMLFDRRSLEPMFQLSVGEPGSSFTFEVAEKNFIPKRLIKEAQSRVHSGKLELDQSIGSLQKEKHRIEEKSNKLTGKLQKAENAKEDYLFRKEELEFKLMRLQQTAEENNLLINLGKRMNKLIESYNGKNLKEQTKQFVKFLKIEHTKRQKPAKKSKPKIAPIEKQKAKKDLLRPKKRKFEKVKKGDTVSISGGTEKGKVLDIEGKKAHVLFGQFKTQVDLSKLVHPD